VIRNTEHISKQLRAVEADTTASLTLNAEDMSSPAANADRPTTPSPVHPHAILTDTTTRVASANANFSEGMSNFFVLCMWDS
jgi:hypothetical protein